MSNRDVEKEIEEMVAQNDAIAAEVQTTLASFAPICEAAVAQTTSWGQSSEATSASMESVAAENQACQVKPSQ